MVKLGIGAVVGPQIGGGQLAVQLLLRRRPRRCTGGPPTVRLPVGTSAGGIGSASTNGVRPQSTSAWLQVASALEHTTSGLHRPGDPRCRSSSRRRCSKRQSAADRGWARRCRWTGSPAYRRALVQSTVATARRCRAPRRKQQATGAGGRIEVDLQTGRNTAFAGWRSASRWGYAPRRPPGSIRS